MECKVSRSDEFSMEAVNSGGHWTPLYEALAVWFVAKTIEFKRVSQDWLCSTYHLLSQVSLWCY